MYFWVVTFFVFILDRFSKNLVVSFLELQKTYPLIRNVFHLTLVKNQGAAFGLFPGYLFLFLIISFSAVILIFYLYLNKKIKGRLEEIALGLILGGTLGNLYDRFIYGAVIDFLDFRVWPVFNLADSAITTGVFLLIWGCWKDKFDKADE